MAGLSYPFDAGPGSTITEDQWSYLVKDSLGDGVHEDSDAPYSGELEVYSISEPGIVRVRAGRATINGFHYQQAGEEIIAVTANANTTMDRIDAVVLKLDLTTDAITLEAKLGVPATTPVPPTVTATELLLATILVPRNSNTVDIFGVTDFRTYIGRRMLVSKSSANPGVQGDILYAPSADKWYGMPEDGFRKALAFEEEIEEHVEASDPHPQYLTLAEGSEQVFTSSFANDPTFTTHAEYHRAIKLPGGRYINNLFYFGTFNGATNEGEYPIGTISEAAMRPNFVMRFPGQQWRFANAPGAYPLLVAVSNTGQVHTTSTWLEGGARILFNATFFSGPGV